MGKSVIMVRLPRQWRTLDDVIRVAGIAPGSVEQFALIDPDTNDYSLLADESALGRLQSTPGITVSGPFSNPKIEPFSLRK